MCDCSQCDLPIVLDKPVCLTQCRNLCNVNSNEWSLLYLCMFIGFFFVTSIVTLSSSIKEESHLISKEDSYFIPTLYRMMKNKPFINLLIPWIIDTTISQIFATMLPFFITSVSNPQKYCVKNNIDLTNQICNANSWLGITIFSFFIFCIPTTLLWHLVVKSIGKKKAWQSYSVICVITYSLFLFIGEGMMTPLVVFSIINSIPAGGAYLNDVFLSDTIDYDEFITGKRNEGIYMVFSSFTPKIVGIFAQSIPLSVMSCKYKPLFILFSNWVYTKQGWTSLRST